jgi:hypothetical protein
MCQLKRVDGRTHNDKSANLAMLKNDEIVYLEIMSAVRNRDFRIDTEDPSSAQPHALQAMSRRKPRLGKTRYLDWFKPLIVLVPGGGVEPPRPCDRRILSFLRIPYVYDN